MSLLSRLREKQVGKIATATPATFATQERERGRTVASVATVAVANPPEVLAASRWWRLHFPDREPVEVASFPPSTHAEILERYPDAVAAEPFVPERAGR